jgi:hypothetical protein
LLAVDVGAEQLLDDALRIDPNFALGHAVAATVASERGAPRRRVQRHLRAARRSADNGTEREASFIEAAELTCSLSIRAAPSLVRHVRRWPGDAYAVSLIAPSISSGGVSAENFDVWALPDDLVGVYGPDEWSLASLRSFGRAEQLRWSEAESLVSTALSSRPSSGHAAHALAHVHYETGRHREGLAWLDQWLAGDGSRQLFRGHFAWHAALIELQGGDSAAVSLRFDRELAPLRGERAVVDAASLLVRAALHGHHLGAERATAVMDATGEAARSSRSPFVGWNAALLLGLRNDHDGLDALEAHARVRATSEEETDEGWGRLISVCEAVRAQLGGDHLRAAALFEAADDAVLGGSPAQRELFDDLVLVCLIRAGECEAARRRGAARAVRRPSARACSLRRSGNPRRLSPQPHTGDEAGRDTTHRHRQARPGGLARATRTRPVSERAASPVERHIEPGDRDQPTGRGAL